MIKRIGGYTLFSLTANIPQADRLTLRLAPDKLARIKQVCLQVSHSSNARVHVWLVRKRDIRLPTTAVTTFPEEFAENQDIIASALVEGLGGGTAAYTAIPTVIPIPEPYIDVAGDISVVIWANASLSSISLGADVYFEEIEASSTKLLKGLK